MFDVMAVQRRTGVCNKAIHESSRHRCKVNEVTALEAASREEHKTQLPSCRSAHFVILRHEHLDVARGICG